MKIDAKIIQCACDALKEAKIVSNEGTDEGTFPEEFKGYTSAFGVAVVQMGLYPALLIYEDKNANTSAERYKLADALRFLLIKLYGYKYNCEKLSQLYADNESQRKEMQAHVDTALVALKLALRIYEPNKKNNA